MLYTKLEILFANASFFLLFFAMLLSWVVPSTKQSLKERKEPNLVSMPPNTPAPFLTENAGVGPSGIDKQLEEVLLKPMSSPLPESIPSVLEAEPSMHKTNITGMTEQVLLIGSTAVMPANSAKLNDGSPSRKQEKSILADFPSVNFLSELLPNPSPGGYKKTTLRTIQKSPGFFNGLLLTKTACIYSSFFSTTFLMFFRFIESGHLPLSNLYESLIFLSWSCLAIHLILDISFPTLALFSSPATISGALFINGFANFSLPLEMQQSMPLVPALQSNWLMMHVSVMILSYSALILGSLFAIVYLVFDWFNNQDSRNFLLPFGFNAAPRNLDILQKNPRNAFGSKNETLSSFAGIKTSDSFLPEQKASLPAKEAAGLFILRSEAGPQTGSTGILPAASNKSQRSQINQTRLLFLDNLSYRLLGIGFPLLTIGILSGAVWANEAWGSYWSWDPKETWALLTWLVFAIYLHTRITKGWQGKKAALLASVGFLTVWMCFLGVNLLGQGLHSYGWFSS